MSEEEEKDPTPEGRDAAASAEEQEKAAAAARAKAEAAAAARAKKAAEEAAKPPWERDPEAPERRDAAADPLVESLRHGFGEAVISAETIGEDLVIEVSRGGVRAVCESLAEDHGYRLLVDICGADYPKREGERFEVVYHVFNLDENRRVRLKARVAEGDEIPSVTSVWRGADWCEREVYDMYGISFDGHPDMSRILMWDGFNGHPLRKDFPIEGVDTGAAIYPESYGESAGPVAGTGSGWKPPKVDAKAPEDSDEANAGKDGSG